MTTRHKTSLKFRFFVRRFTQSTRNQGNLRVFSPVTHENEQLKIVEKKVNLAELLAGCLIVGITFDSMWR